MTELALVSARDRETMGFAALVGLTAAAVFITVGWVPTVLAVAVLLTDRFIIPGRGVVGAAAVSALVALPIVWFAGSSLPLTPPAPRIMDNVWAHQLGGLAVWLLFLAAWLDRAATPDNDGPDTDTAVESRATTTIDRMSSDTEAT